jgi:hypothetical protein
MYASERQSPEFFWRSSTTLRMSTSSSREGAAAAGAERPTDRPASARITPVMR